MAWFKCMGGSYTDYSNKTVTASAVTSDSNYTYLTIPNEGIYNTGSKVRTLNSNLVKIKKVLLTTVGSTQNINLTSYKGWENFTNDNFSLTPNGSNSWSWGQNANWRISGTGSISYNATNGVLTVSPITGQYGFNWQYGCNMNTNVYLHYVE